jgi:peptidoglycan/LPS O-acetylase OafA/YrhL
VADGTFTIYLMHYPMLVAATYLGLIRPQHSLVTIATASVICLLLIWAAIPVDRIKLFLRRILRARFPERRTANTYP